MWLLFAITFLQLLFAATFCNYTYPTTKIQARIMQRLLFVLLAVIAALGIAGYFFTTSLEPTPSSASPTPITPDNTEAKRHISQLTQPSQQPIDIKTADNFVTAEQLLQLPEPKQASQVALEALPTETATSESASGAQDNSATDGTFAVASHLNVISAGNKGRQQPSNDIIAGTSVVAINGNQIKLQELLDSPDQAKEKIFFIHAVNDSDRKGLWGIIQAGLTQTFTQGLNLPGLDQTVYVDIPQEADEKLQDKRSSFLGRILKNKVDKTYIYNYEKGILGDNPDLIKPGQQLVIVTFTEQELIGIYHHFVNL